MDNIKQYLKTIFKVNYLRHFHIKKKKKQMQL